MLDEVICLAIRCFYAGNGVMLIDPLALLSMGLVLFGVDLPGSRTDTHPERPGSQFDAPHA